MHPPLAAIDTYHKIENDTIIIEIADESDAADKHQQKHQSVGSRCANKLNIFVLIIYTKYNVVVTTALQYREAEVESGDWVRCTLAQVVADADHPLPSCNQENL